MLVIATIPVGLVGLVGEHFFRTHLGKPVPTAIFLIVNGLILFGLRKEVIENRAPDPEEVLAGVDAVTGEDVQRVARDLIDDEKLRLALIGPFEDADRFEKLL